MPDVPKFWAKRFILAFRRNNSVIPIRNQKEEPGVPLFGLAPHCE